MEPATVYDLTAVNQRHFRHFQFLVQRDSLGRIASVGNDKLRAVSTSVSAPPTSTPLFLPATPARRTTPNNSLRFTLMQGNQAC
jgi:hypothetical protein